MTLQAPLTFTVSSSLRTLAQNTQTRPNRDAKILDAASMKGLDRYYFDQMDAYFETHFRTSYTFRLDGIHSSDHQDLIRTVQPIERFAQPIVVRSHLGKLYGNQNAKQRHLDEIASHTQPLHAHVRQELGLNHSQAQLQMFNDDKLPAEEFHQVVVNESDFEAIRSGFFLSCEDQYLLHHIFGESTVHEAMYLNNFPGLFTSKDLVFTRLPALSFAISAGHFSNLKLSTRTGMSSSWLNPIFVDPEEYPLTVTNMLHWHENGVHPIFISPKHSIKIQNENGLSTTQPGFISTFRSLISFLRANMMPDFVKNIYKSALHNVNELPDDIKALPEVQDLLFVLARQENSSRMMTLMRIDTPSLLLQRCIEKLLKNTDHVRLLRITRKQNHLSEDDLTNLNLHAIKALRSLLAPLRALEEQKRYEFTTLFRRNLAKAQLQDIK